MTFIEVQAAVKDRQRNSGIVADLCIRQLFVNEWALTKLPFCGMCDGTGWIEGGETIQTRCPKCDGTARKGGAVYAVENRQLYAAIECEILFPFEKSESGHPMLFNVVDQTVECAICGWVDWEDESGEIPKHSTDCPVGFLTARTDQAHAVLRKWMSWAGSAGASLTECMQATNEVLKGSRP